MKHIILMIGLCSPAMTLLGQKMDSNEIPVDVRNGLEMNLHVKEARWEKEGSNYEANFKSGGKETSVVLDEKGVILETEVEIHKNELPSMAKSILKKDFSSYKVHEAEKIIAKGIITYEVQVEKLEKTFELTFDIQGKLLDQKEEKSELGDKD